MRHAFVGLGEGIGNCLMGAPLVDALWNAGWKVRLNIRATPPEMAGDLAELLHSGRWEGLRHVPLEVGPEESFDLAVLTHWWVSCGGPFPKARETRVGHAPSETEPEIVANLAALRGLVPTPDPTVHVHVGRGPVHLVDGLSPIVALHPGCKPDSEWRARKVYPRWHEVVHRLKQEGAGVIVLGSEADADLYVGEPHADLRGERLTLIQTAERMNSCDVVLSGDSGLHHLAVGLGKPAVAVFGRSSAVKASHPKPRGPAPVILGPFDDPAAFAGVSPRTIARACVRAARRARQREAVR